MKTYTTTLLAFAIASTFASCSEDDDLHAAGTANSDYIEAADCTGQTPTYTADIAPILDLNCALSGCHNAATATHGLSLEGYDAASGNFNLHNLLCAINHTEECNAMPQGQPKLADADILAITCWAKNGFQL